jgi:two-component system, chemotaxis family, chemotaxis protein CheY
MRLMTVDDSPVVRKIIRAATDMLRYELVEAVNGVDAFNVLEKVNGDVDLILLDWNMPGMNGYEFLTKLKESDVYKKIPVMMVTTESQNENIVTAIKAGAVQYVIKPFSMEELIKKIKESLGRGRVNV